MARGEPRRVRTAHRPASSARFWLRGFAAIGARCAPYVLLVACGQPTPEPTTPAEPRDPVETRARVDRAVATTGDLITYNVTVDHDPSYEVELPEPGAEIAGFRIVDVGREEPREADGRVVRELWYQLRADLVGSYVLPPITVAYRPKTEEGAEPAEAREIETSEIFVEVQSVLPADGEVTDIRGLKPLREIERPLPWWPFAAGAGALVLLLAAFLFWRRRRQGPVVPPRPAHEVAFEALERLRGTDFSDPEAVRRFHFEISEVIRAYVERRFGLNATDLTTEEIVARLDEIRALGPGERERLRRFLSATDQVKFAAREPAEDEIQGTYEDALSFVEETRERPEETNAAEESTGELREAA